MCPRMKLYNLEDLAFSSICYSTVNAVHFNVISKADKQVCALQESLKEDGLFWDYSPQQCFKSAEYHLVI